MIRWAPECGVADAAAAAGCTLLRTLEVEAALEDALTTDGDDVTVETLVLTAEALETVVDDTTVGVDTVDVVQLEDAETPELWLTPDEADGVFEAAEEDKALLGTAELVVVGLASVNASVSTFSALLYD